MCVEAPVGIRRALRFLLFEKAFYGAKALQNDRLRRWMTSFYDMLRYSIFELKGKSQCRHSTPFNQSLLRDAKIGKVLTLCNLFGISWNNYLFCLIWGMINVHPFALLRHHRHHFPLHLIKEKTSNFYSKINKAYSNLLSPYSITISANIQVMRIKQIMKWNVLVFNQILWTSGITNTRRPVKRIWVLMSGLKGLRRLSTLVCRDCAARKMNSLYHTTPYSLSRNFNFDINN